MEEGNARRSRSRFRAARPLSRMRLAESIDMAGMVEVSTIPFKALFIVQLTDLAQVRPDHVTTPGATPPCTCVTQISHKFF